MRDVKDLIDKEILQTRSCKMVFSRGSYRNPARSRCSVTMRNSKQCDDIDEE